MGRTLLLLKFFFATKDLFCFEKQYISQSLVTVYITIQVFHSLIGVGIFTIKYQSSLGSRNYLVVPILQYIDINLNVVFGYTTNLYQFFWK